MAISFAQSMQSIQRDHGRFSLAGTILALLAVLVWGAWFFLSPLPVYEYGVIVKSTRDGSVVTQFALSVGGQIHLGQEADLYFQSPQNDTSEKIRAFVTEISETKSGDQLLVTFYPEVDIDLARRMAEGESGEAEIEVERISPARLVLRVSGQFVETAPVSFMPKAQ